MCVRPGLAHEGVRRARNHPPRPAASSTRAPRRSPAIPRLFGNMLINFQTSLSQSRCARLGCKPSSEEQVCYNVSNSGPKASWRLELSGGQGAGAI